MSLRILYLLEDTELWGGVKMVLLQADLLSARGHEVTVLSLAPPPDWIELEAEVRQVPDFSPAHVEAADVTIATYWTTIEPAVEGARGEVAHYCQGFEGSFSHNVQRREAIESAYRRGVPALVVSSHLGVLLRERFGSSSHLVPQPLERFWRPPRLPRRGPRVPFRIMVPGLFESDLKGVVTALEAVEVLRSSGFPCELVRLSQWPLTPQEKKIAEPDEYHRLLTPPRVARLLRGCDLLLAPSWEEEGFGLPALEAMASGVPVVATDVPCYRSWARDAAALVPPRDPEALAAAARAVLGNRARWREMRSDGLALARHNRGSRAGEATETAMRWAASGAWRKDHSSGRATT